MATLALLTLVPAFAQAQDKPACLAAAARAQSLRDEHHLVESRQALRLCANAACPPAVRKDCTAWLDQVGAILPSVIPIATDGAGRGLAIAKLSLDGVLLPNTLDGTALELDPGKHTLSFEAADGTKVDQDILVAEGDKNKRVSVILAKLTPPETAPLQPLEPSGEPLRPDAGTALPPGPGSTSALKIAGLVTAGVGVVGLGLGGYFGVKAMSGKSNAGCDGNSVCPNAGASEVLRDARSAGNLSTIFFVGGGLLAAGGVILWLAGPSGSLQASPALSTNGAGVQLKGSW